jgi:hypothetical protein
MRNEITFAVALLVPALAAAEPESRGPQLQIDGGLSVIGPGYEHPLGEHVSLQAEVFIFGTYFLPWFDLGEEVKGFGAGLRPTWFANADGHGLYVTPYVRGAIVDDEAIFGASGLALTAGAFVGWAFALSDKLDLRLGGGVQYIHAHVETDTGDERFGTPFVAIDGTLGYRL